MVEVASRVQQLFRRVLPESQPDDETKVQLAELREMIAQLDTQLSEVGDRYCPLCDNSVWQFAPAGVRKRPNVKCPYCDSWERHRFLWLYLQQETSFLDDEIKLLHFAPEACLRTHFENRTAINYVTADLLRDDVDAKTDIQDLIFDDAEFDVIVCSHVLEHIPNDANAIAELYRVLRPGGTAIVMVPIRAKYGSELTYEDPTITDPKDREREFGQFDHVRWYGRDLVSRLEGPSFAVTQIDYLKHFSNGQRRLYGLPGRDFIFRCDKPM